MFNSTQFEENLSSFQKLLAEGVFDNTLPGVKAEDCRTLKRFVLCYLTKSKWVEQYNLLKVSTGDMTEIPFSKRVALSPLMKSYKILLMLTLFWL